MENEGTIIMVVIGFITFLLTFGSTIAGVVWLLANTKNNLQLLLNEKISKVEQDNKDLKLELKQEMRDRIHKARNDIGGNIYKIDEIVDDLEKNQTLIFHRIEQIEKCLNSKSVCDLKE